MAYVPKLKIDQQHLGAEIKRLGQAVEGLDASAAELDTLDGVVAGTVTASKAVVVGANKNVDVLAVLDLKLGAGAGTSMTSTAAELNLLDGSIAGTTVASKALVVDANKTLDTLDLTELKVGTVVKTNVVIGAAAGYKIARSAAPVALDGSNPTSVAHGLTTCVAAGASLAGTAAPGVGTHLLTVTVNGANLDVRGWKPTGTGDCTMIASDGIETFHWWAVGT